MSVPFQMLYITDVLAINFHINFLCMSMHHEEKQACEKEVHINDTGKTFVFPKANKENVFSVLNSWK